MFGYKSISSILREKVCNCKHTAISKIMCEEIKTVNIILILCIVKRLKRATTSINK